MMGSTLFVNHIQEQVLYWFLFSVVVSLLFLSSNKSELVMGVLKPYLIPNRLRFMDSLEDKENDKEY